MITESVIRRFNKKFSIIPSGCWIWTGAKCPKGYGFMSVGKSLWRAHRISWTIKNGPIPPRMDICHKCDTPSCVNPDHLFVGTRADNIHDMIAKGRWKPLSRKQVCYNGHRLTEDNIKVQRGKSGEINRTCRMCYNLAQKAFRKRRKEENAV